ncbi:major facilitator superfamily domain-containing protein [Phthorimaea operculella]|nr:major facilitator superfamily domain-containing protein [Phthorimaea operculella]
MEASLSLMKSGGMEDRTEGTEGKSKKGSLCEKPFDLDDVLINELGQFGRFQLNNLILFAIPIMMCPFMGEFVFSAAAIPHRCVVPECGEKTKNEIFEPDWLKNAIPTMKGGSGFESCERFAPAPYATHGTLNFCPASIFNQSNTIPCDGYVYQRDNSVVYDFDLGCQEWLRTLAGTLNSVGTLLVLPITGYVSDKYGRRIALVVSVFNLALFGLIRAFSVNYPMYLALQIIQTTLGAGTFSSAYIFGAELVGPKWRVITSATLLSMFALGHVILGSVAWAIQSWRYMIMVLHIPCFLIVSYYWILSESVRWLLSKKRYDEAKVVLEKVARVNNRTLSEENLRNLMNPPATAFKLGGEVKKPGLLKAIMQSRVLRRRVCTSPVWWITMTFVYYGLSINSIGWSGNMYLNYIYVSAIEIPGFFTAVLVLDRIGRKATLSGGFFLSAASNIASAFVMTDMVTLRLSLFLVGKFGISIVFMSLYLYTAELYPTEYRHTLLAYSSMIGRVGSIIAPLTPALMVYWQGLPAMLFGAMGLLSGLLVLTQPETLGAKMPDTLAEAEAIGRKTADN